MTCYVLNGTLNSTYSLNYRSGYVSIELYFVIISTKISDLNLDTSTVLVLMAVCTVILDDGDSNAFQLF